GEVHLGEWGERWLATTTHLKPKTVVGYDSLLRSRILPTFEQVPIGAIRPIDIRVWLSQMQADGLSASRCRQAYHLLGAPNQRASGLFGLGVQSRVVRRGLAISVSMQVRAGFALVSSGLVLTHPSWAVSDVELFEKVFGEDPAPDPAVGSPSRRL
ncbi:MAG TPA: hypothetical protein VMU64_08395, partial [Acidimicrobiales bacterium]|nr:hypothetical protein [Acidimicrobiales bacterium]